MTSSHRNWPPKRAAWPNCVPPRSPSRPRPGRRRRKRQRKGPRKGASKEEAQAAGAKAAEGAIPAGRAQRNFTDPESRMMKTKDGFQYAFNAQAMVDEEAQVIVAHSVSDEAADPQHLLEMIETSEANLGAAGIDENPDTVITDAGYFSEKNVTDATDTGVDVLIATGRIKYDEQVPPAPRGPVPKDATVKERMARRLRTKAGRADYARRKAIVEPVFGQMKVRQAAGFLRLRGLEGAKVSGRSTRCATTCASWPWASV